MQVECLVEVGVPAQFVCMMASKAPGILARTPEQLRAVADHVRSRGFEGGAPSAACDATTLCGLVGWKRSLAC